MTAQQDDAPAGHGAPSLPLLGTAGFASVSCTRLCDAMLPALALAFATTAAEAAATIYGYAIAYSVMLLVCGPLGDRFGKRRLITLAVAACALTTASAALAPTLPALVAIRVAMG